ncbi:Protein unc-50 [Intoshia linei]|uniref:Protein unc-50 n=1 Tax=Intoshia linei TaxID=1819745 RepID=A0A177B869_9BILA|nr:Protein unc-50 [Intoshia linei]
MLCFNNVEYSAEHKFKRFFSRMLNFRQMDLEYACWQSWILITNPQKMYRIFDARKASKNQFARDDPSFFLLSTLILIVLDLMSIIIIKICFLSSFLIIPWFIYNVVFMYAFAGIIAATFFWFFLNYTVLPQYSEQIEWAYCFDVHLNSIFPCMVARSVIVKPLYLIIQYITDLHNKNYLTVFTLNTTCLLCVFYYLYISYIGYRMLLNRCAPAKIENDLYSISQRVS